MTWTSKGYLLTNGCALSRKAYAGVSMDSATEYFVKVGTDGPNASYETIDMYSNYNVTIELPYANTRRPKPRCCSKQRTQTAGIHPTASFTANKQRGSPNYADSSLPTRSRSLRPYYRISVRQSPELSY